MNRKWSYALWGTWLAAFAAAELPATREKVPWSTLSTTSWDLQERYPWTSIFIQGGLSILQVHIVRVAGLLAGDGK